MKKLTAMILALVMVLTLAAGAFAAGRLTKDEAKKIALDKAGVTAAEATFTKARLDITTITTTSMIAMTTTTMTGMTSTTVTIMTSTTGTISTD